MRSPLTDRVHPVKRYRPIASGRVSVPLAVGSMSVFFLVGLGAMWLLSPLLGVISLLYLAINLGYSLGIKQIVLMDVAEIDQMRVRPKLCGYQTNHRSI